MGHYRVSVGDPYQNLNKRIFTPKAKSFLSMATPLPNYLFKGKCGNILTIVSFETGKFSIAVTHRL